MSQISIVCNFDLGVKYQTVYACNATTNQVLPIGEFELAALPDIMANTYQQYQAKAKDNNIELIIYLYGPEDLIKNLAQEIATIGAQEYACNFIKIELN